MATTDYGEAPAFEIHQKEGEDGPLVLTHAIYADGRITGFRDGAVVVNRIPSREAAARAQGMIDGRRGIIPPRIIVEPKHARGMIAGAEGMQAAGRVELDAQAAINDHAALLDQRKALYATLGWTWIDAAQKDIEAITEMHDVPIGPKGGCAEEGLRRSRLMAAMKTLDEAFQSKDEASILEAANNLTKTKRELDAARHAAATSATPEQKP